MMYQRKDKSEKIIPGNSEGILDLFRLLESTDPEEVESVKNVIHENLSTAKDSKLLNWIVDYYLAVQSERSLDILVRVKDPHDKHLFDKLNELLKSEGTCYQALQLLSNLVYRQSSWIYKIANHRLMHSLFHLLKNDTHAPNLISALFIIVCLLPMIPSQFGPFLQDTFDVFSRLIAWNVKKPSAISETFILHLQVAVYSLFHRLYGMFPCNFLAYLRSYYGGRDYREENFRVFTIFIKPMLERVRLHPLLVTASKDTELSANRWKKMEYHDVITECATISLDVIEGTLEGLRGKNQNINTLSRRHGNFSAQNSMQYVNLSSQNSVTSVTLEQGSTVDEAVSSHRGSLWSPSHSYISNTPAPLTLNSSSLSLINKNESEIKHQKAQPSVEENLPLDLAVEAKPEDLKAENKASFHQKLEKSISSDSSNVNIYSSQDDPYNNSKRDSIDICSIESVNSSTEKNILCGVEVKEEGMDTSVDTDKEVSDLTSVQSKSTDIISGDQRHDTPFCCTTQTLTDDPKNLLNCTEIKSDMLTKSHEEDDEMYNSMQDAEEETYIPSFNRYRFVSQCGPPPVIPSDALQKPKVIRSISCPAKFCPSSQSSVIPERISGSNSISKTDVIVATCSSTVITTSSAFVSINNNAILNETRNFPYEQLIPMAMEPLPDICHPPNASLESNYCSYNTLFHSLSPPELLDNYIQLGSVTYANQSTSIPITSTKNTDWTHFGGKPPLDEVDILRNQILLLHDQLLFERHRKDVHSERIRRILGRAKKSKIQEELIIALKEQINLLVKDNEELKYELSHQTRMNDQFKSETKQIEAELNNFIKKLKFENTQLLFSNKKLQSLLVTQKEENDQIISKCKAAQSRIVDVETELDLCKQEVECYRKLKNESEFLSKQMFLLQEINNMYKEKINQLKEPTNPNSISADIFNETAAIEINDLKRKLESTCVHYDAAKSKNLELEQHLNNMKQKEKEQFKQVESIKYFHQDQIKVCDQNLEELKKISIQKDAFILQLHKEKELLSKKIDTLEKKLNGASHASSELCDTTTCHVQENANLSHSHDFSTSTSES